MTEKNSKLNKRNAIICVVMLVLLVISMCLNMTGAYFTSQKQATAGQAYTFTLGHSVTLNKASGVLSATYNSTPVANIFLLPGMTINVSSITYSGDVMAYYRITMISSDAKKTSGTDLTTQQKGILNDYFTQSAVYGTVNVGGTISPSSLTLSTDINDTFQDTQVTLAVSVTVLQAENIGISAQQAFQTAGI